ENAAALAQSQLAHAREALDGAREQADAHAQAVRRIAQEMTELLARFSEAEAGEDPLEGLATAWRDDRVAARLLTEARANWRHAVQRGQAPRDPSGDR